MNLERSQPPKSSASVKLNLRWLPLVCGLLLVLQFVFPYRGWAVLGIALGIVWLVGFLWARSLARGLHLSREMRYGWAQVGDRIEERFTVENDSWMPALWFEVIDHSTLPGYDVSRASGVGRAVEQYLASPGRLHAARTVHPGVRLRFAPATRSVCSR